MKNKAIILIAILLGVFSWTLYTGSIQYLFSESIEKIPDPISTAATNSNRRININRNKESNFKDVSYIREYLVDRGHIPESMSEHDLYYLKELKLNKINNDDIIKISQLINLQKLRLANSTASDLLPLENLKYLRDLYIGQFGDVHFSGQMLSLESLKIQQSGGDIKNLEKLINLMSCL